MQARWQQPLTGCLVGDTKAAPGRSCAHTPHTARKQQQHRSNQPSSFHHCVNAVPYVHVRPELCSAASTCTGAGPASSLAAASGRPSPGAVHAVGVQRAHRGPHADDGGRRPARAPRRDTYAQPVPSLCVGRRKRRSDTRHDVNEHVVGHAWASLELPGAWCRRSGLHVSIELAVKIGCWRDRNVEERSHI